MQTVTAYSDGAQLIDFGDLQATVAADGRVIWCDDWARLVFMAASGIGGFSVRHSQPLNHTDIFLDVCTARQCFALTNGGTFDAARGFAELSDQLPTVREWCEFLTWHSTAL